MGKLATCFFLFKITEVLQPNIPEVVDVFLDHSTKFRNLSGSFRKKFLIMVFGRFFHMNA